MNLLFRSWTLWTTMCFFSPGTDLQTLLHNGQVCPWSQGGKSTQVTSVRDLAWVLTWLTCPALLSKTRPHVSHPQLFKSPGASLMVLFCRLHLSLPWLILFISNESHPEFTALLLSLWLPVNTSHESTSISISFKFLMQSLNLFLSLWHGCCPIFLSP